MYMCNLSKVNNIVKLTVIVVLLLLPVLAFSDNLKKVEGEYIYHATEQCTVEQAKQTALMRAKLQALSEAFGTVVSQTNSTRVEVNDGNSSTDFLSIGSSDIKGEWIETIGQPEYKVEYLDKMLVVSVKVRGLARELTTQKIDIDVHLLKNGTEDRFEDDNFRVGDQMYLSFQSPVDGFLTIYLVDSESKAYCLLPYRGQTDGAYNINANKRYLFFCKNKANSMERHYVDEYILTCNGDAEHNQIYVLFSPVSYTKANDNEILSSLPRELDYDDFMRWLSKRKRLDTNLNSMMFPITITDK